MSRDFSAWGRWARENPGAKNRKGRIFDAARDSGSILLFDDAHFGKRPVVKDGHDRYANVETAFLLQR